MTVATRFIGTGPVPDGGARVSLTPEVTVVANRNAGNPTFPADSIPESIVKVGSTYWCVYQGSWVGGNWDIRLAHTTDLTGSWTAYSGNPILMSANSGWEDKIYAPEIMESGGTFYIFYSSVTGAALTGDTGVASAPAVTGPWTKYGSNPVLSVSGTSSDWDSRRVGEPSVVVVDGTWVMAYMGETLDVTAQQSEKVGIATASSAFGPWTKQGMVLDYDTGTWDDGLIADPYIFHHGGRYWIAYAGSVIGTNPSHRVGLAYASVPGGPWTKHQSNPVLAWGSVGAFDERASWRGSIFEEDGRYYGVYGGQNDDISAVRGGSYELAFSY